MKIPNGMTEEEVIATIEKVCQKCCGKYTFYYYDSDDIYQEAFMLGMDGLKRYRPKLGDLENFLSVHISNKLKSFKRDNYARQEPERGTPEWEAWNNCYGDRIAINSAIPLDRCSVDELERNMQYVEDYNENMYTQSILDKINERLPLEMREDYLRMREGAFVYKKRREMILEVIKEIVNEV